MTIGDNEISFYQSGIFDLDNLENPFKDYTLVFAPVCTGDVHTGNNVQTYQSGDKTLTIYHRGFVNTISALNWAYANLTQPESIFVTGCSAGSVGSILFAPYVIQHYADTPVVQLGDSLSFVFHRPVNLQTDYHAHDNFPNWIPALAAIKPGEFTTARFYSALANFYPNYTFAQYNAQQDRVQGFYYQAVGGDPANWVRDFEASLGTIHTNAPNFRSFTAGGNMHCITPRSEFYSYQSDGVRFRDWVADLSDGKTVSDVHCVDCDKPEIYHR